MATARALAMDEILMIVAGFCRCHFTSAVMEVGDEEETKSLFNAMLVSRQWFAVFHAELWKESNDDMLADVMDSPRLHLYASAIRWFQVNSGKTSMARKLERAPLSNMMALNLFLEGERQMSTSWLSLLQDRLQILGICTSQLPPAGFWSAVRERSPNLEKVILGAERSLFSTPFDYVRKQWYCPTNSQELSFWDYIRTSKINCLIFELSSLDFRAEYFTAITEMECLEKLSLTDAKVTKKLLNKAIRMGARQMPKLKQLDFDGITPDQADLLAYGMPNLAWLVAHVDGPTTQQIASLGAFHSLTKLQIASPQGSFAFGEEDSDTLAAEGLIAVCEGCPRLTLLEIALYPFDDAHPELASEYEKGFGLSDELVEASVAKLTELKRFSISVTGFGEPADCDLTTKSLRTMLKACRHLEEVEMLGVGARFKLSKLMSMSGRQRSLTGDLDGGPVAPHLKVLVVDEFVGKVNFGYLAAWKASDAPKLRELGVIATGSGLQQCCDSRGSTLIYAQKNNQGDTEDVPYKTQCVGRYHGVAEGEGRGFFPSFRH